MIRMIPDRIISGGQTGADRGGLEAALTLGISIGGHCPKGRRAEDGRIPDGFPLIETDSRDYPPRTRLNILNSDGTVVFVKKGLGRGSRLTLDLCYKMKKPCLLIDFDVDGYENIMKMLKGFVDDNNIKILNVAGSRESKNPGIQLEVSQIIWDTFS